MEINVKFKSKHNFFKSSTKIFSMDSMVASRNFPPFFKMSSYYQLHNKQLYYNYKNTFYIFSYHKQASNYSLSTHLTFTAICYKVSIYYSNCIYFKSCIRTYLKWFYCISMSVGQRGSGIHPGSTCTYTKSTIYNIHTKHCK